jgi:hypothetical protein
MVLPRLRAGFPVKAVMITVFFTATRLIALNSLPQGQSFTQDYFICEIVPAFTKEKLRLQSHHPGVVFSVDRDDFRHHNGRMATAEFDRRRFGRTGHPPYSPDPNPCDLWFPEGKAQGSPITRGPSLHQVITDLSDERTFEDVQAVLLEWMNRLSWVIENKGESFTKRPIWI